MSQFINNSMYNLSVENEAERVLAHFEPEQIADIMEKNIQDRLNPYSNSIPNIIVSIEQNFKQTMIMYPGDIQAIKEKRNQIYIGIIDTLAKYNNLVVNKDNIDLYSMAYYLCDMLLSNYRIYIKSFFVNFINREKNNIYMSLNLEDMRKNKDASTVYAKKVYKNQKIGTIISNLEYIVDSICTFDIPFDVFINNIYTDKNIVNFILYNVSPTTDFFNTNIASVFKSQSGIRQVLISDLRLELHNFIMANQQPFDIHDTITKE